MAVGGARPGAGRKPGSTNRMSLAARERAAAAGELPHEFLLRISRGEPIEGHKPTFSERVDAAKVAAPYYAPKLASMTVQQPRRPFEVPDVRDVAELSTPELIKSVLGSLSADDEAWRAAVNDSVLRPALEDYISRLALQRRD
jgi:hypothetical protein